VCLLAPGDVNFKDIFKICSESRDMSEQNNIGSSITFHVFFIEHRERANEKVYFVESTAFGTKYLLLLSLFQLLFPHSMLHPMFVLRLCESFKFIPMGSELEIRGRGALDRRERAAICACELA
jgi:hypothetical protein